MKKLFLDDIRDPWDTDWHVVRDANQFQRWVEKNGIPEVVAFDHDLGSQHYTAYARNENYEEGTGYDCAEWLIMHAVKTQAKLPSIVIVHSWNSAGAKRIGKLFESTSATMVFPYPCTPLKALISKL